MFLTDKMTFDEDDTCQIFAMILIPCKISFENVFVRHPLSNSLCKPQWHASCDFRLHHYIKKQGKSLNYNYREHIITLITWHEHSHLLPMVYIWTFSLHLIIWVILDFLKNMIFWLGMRPIGRMNIRIISNILISSYIINHLNFLAIVWAQGIKL